LEQESLNTSNIIAIIALIVSILSGLAVAFFSAWITSKYQSKIKVMDSTTELIEKFYGPILSILTENEMLYKEFGPNKFMGRTAEVADAKGATWNSLKDKVIKPNLILIRQLIQKHWIQSEAENKTYLKELFFHCSAFCEYDESPNEMYSKYKYKPEWKTLIKNESDRLIKETKNE
tara:strand:- start:328 stop:855 length:528 start_codon:yes stop_codon:yes gene_type:complete